MWTDKLAFIGAGNIAEVFMDRLISIGSISPSHVFACDVRADRRTYLRIRFKGLHTSEDPREAVQFARCVIVATPPPMVLPVLKEIRPLLTKQHVIICLATAVSLAKLEEVLGDVQVVRAAMNIPSLVGEGMNAVAYGSKVTPETKKSTQTLLDLFGRKLEVSDEQMDFWVTIYAAGPACILPVIDVLAKAAAARGVNHDQALAGAAQIVLGAARMVLQTGKEPIDLGKLSAGLREATAEEGLKFYTQAYEEAAAKLKELAAAKV
jgi:pyrroline-5-carboxylate reductase